MHRMTVWFCAFALSLAAVAFCAASAAEPVPAPESSGPARALPEVAKKMTSAKPSEKDADDAESEEDARKSGPFGGMKFRFIGPPGNRVSAVVGVPGNPNVYYAGAASGGVWKSIDGGNEWKAMLDKEEAQ